MEEGKKQPENMRNIGIIVAFVIVILIIGAVVIAKLEKKANQSNMYSANTNQTTPVATMTPMITPTPTVDTSNTQLDQDLQNSQGNLDKLDTQLNTTDQSINNQSADTPTQ